MIRKILVVTTFAALSGAFFFISAHAQDVDVSPRVRNACAGLGYNPSEESYYACLRSFGDVQASMDEGARMRREGVDCRQNGYRPGTSAYAVCVLDREKTALRASARSAAVQTSQFVSGGGFFDSYRTEDQANSGRRFYHSHAPDIYARQYDPYSRYGTAPSGDPYGGVSAPGGN